MQMYTTPKNCGIECSSEKFVVISITVGESACRQDQNTVITVKHDWNR